MSQRQDLNLDERLKAEDVLYAQLLHGGENKLTLLAIAAAVVIHVGVILFAVFPSMGSPVEQQKKDNVIVVKKYVPPPPKIERRQVVQQKITRQIPIPDPTPDEPEPIREPEPEIEPVPVPPDVEFIIGEPEPPPPTGPLIAGTAGVTNPVRIESSYVQPAFPEIARVARVEGNVVLQAIVHKDGSVGEVEVLRVNRPAMGFEQAAVEAVKKWRYEPARQGGKPVDVYFTVVVEFELN